MVRFFALLIFTVHLISSTAFAAPRKILFIGDSHAVASFGHRLDSLLRTLPDTEVLTQASCGSNPLWWIDGFETPCGFFQSDVNGTQREGLKAPTPILKETINSFRPTLILVEQGANLVNAPLNWSAQVSHQLTEVIRESGAACLWIGPPHGRNQSEPGISELNGVLRGASTPPCVYLDSRPFAHYPNKGGDGVHYDHLGPKGVKMMHFWAEKVFEQVKSRY